MDTCKWTYSNQISGNSFYKVECGSLDNLKYYAQGWGEYANKAKAYYHFVFCPFCGKKIERVGS